MTTNEKVARRKLSELELAKERNNASKACKLIGYSRQQFYEIRRNYQTYGAGGLLFKHDSLLRLEKTHREQTIEFNDELIRLLERFSPEFRERQIEVHYTGELVAVDTFFVGALKGGLARSMCKPCWTATAAFWGALHQQAAGDLGSCAQ